MNYKQLQRDDTLRKGDVWFTEKHSIYIAPNRNNRTLCVINGRIYHLTQELCNGDKIKVSLDRLGIDAVRKSENRD